MLGNDDERNRVFFNNFSETEEETIVGDELSRSIFPASAANRNMDQGSSNSRLLVLLLLLLRSSEVNPTLSL